MQVDAGGELVVTQLFYDVELFLKFVKDCRSIGIEVPIIPGEHPSGHYFSTIAGKEILIIRGVCRPSLSTLILQCVV